MKTQPHDNLTRAEAIARAKQVFIPVYSIDFDLTMGDKQFGTQAIVNFHSQTRGSTFIDFVADELIMAKLNGVDIPKEKFNGVRLILDDLEDQNELWIDAICSYRRTGSGFTYFTDPVDGNPYLHTQFEPFDAHAAFPCFDQPDLKGLYTIRVTAPAGWKVASNMFPVAKPKPDEAGVWEFTQTPIISPYLVSVVAGPFHVTYDNLRFRDLGLWCRESLVQYLDAEEIFEVTKQGFDFFEKAFDYEYPFGKYDQLFVPEFRFGAMENPGCVTFSEAYIFRSKVTDAMRASRAGTILHEMAHMWFGDLVTMRWWDDLWLNESFATYMGYLATVEATRFKGAWAGFATGQKGWAITQDQLPTTHPIVADIPDIDATHLNFDGITYAKGASVLKQFVAWAGYDPFLQGVRRYFRKHEWDSATLEDFLEPIAEASGRDLSAWSEQWLQTTGVNTFRIQAEADGSQYKDVTVIQEAKGENNILRSHRIAIGLYDLDGGKLVRRKHVELDAIGARTPVPTIDGDRVADLLLPNDDDLTYAKIRLDERSLQTLITSLSELSDPVARALCWAAVWDMTRDAEWAASDYLDLVANNIASEMDMTVIGGVLARCSTAISYYAHPSKREDVKTRFASKMQQLTREAEPGSDHQLSFMQAWLSAADVADIAELRGLLDGSLSIEGLVIDTDRRWSIVAVLASIDAVDDSDIAAELERDPTDQGQRRAAAIRASRPTPEAKAEAWEKILNEQSLAMLRALAGSFGEPEHPELMKPFVQPYFDKVVDMFNSRGADYGLQFAAGAYPRFTVDQSVIDQTNRFLEDPDIPQPVRRTLLEGADSISRSLAARARDGG